MSNMELEVKVLEINQEELINKILQLGGKLVSKEEQYVYTFDLPTIYGRYLEILLQLNEPENPVKYEIAIEKLKLLFFEIDNLLNLKQKEELKNIVKTEKLEDIIEKEGILEILNSKELKEFISQFRINPNKWIRLRTSNEKTTLTVKHILVDKKNSNLQQMEETEIEVSSKEEANNFLEALGLVHNCYLEKRRIIYSLENHLIEIDTWPKLPTYFELEGSSEEDIERILQLLGYSMKDENVLSCTVDEIYEMYGYPTTSNFRELKF